MTASILIVGASVAGVGAANELRRCGYSGRILLADAQPHLPYDRPPLSKAALADAAVPIIFHDAAQYAALGIDLMLGSAAAALDAANRTVTFASGVSISADSILIATGVRARRLPEAVAAGPVHVIRDTDDAARLRPLLVPGKRLAMIGGGFIGAEVAATAAKLGLEATIFELEDMPLVRILGREVAARVSALHGSAGVGLVCGSGVARIEESEAGAAIILANGDRHEADLVVAGLGAVPNIEWLEGSGLALGDGIICDAFGATSADNIFAAGDVAAWADPSSGKPERHEHWTAAREQARIVAQRIAGASDTLWSAFIPYFWSDMHGKRVQLLGRSDGATTIEIVFENPETGAFVAEYRRDGRLIGVAGLNAAARVMRYSAELSS